MWQTNIFTIFPEAFPGSLGVSLLGDALARGIWQLNLIDLKKFATKSFGRIDSKPYGGGSGMILSPEVFENAFESIDPSCCSMKKIYFSPRGRKLTQADMQKLSQSSGVTMLCGRYEGIDQRIIDYYDFEEISIGDFVLMGGEAAAMVAIEGMVRLLPDVVGNSESICTESFQEPLLEYNQYTKPREFHGLLVPEVLLSGNHQQVEDFHLNESKQLTRKKRPDLWAKYVEDNLNSVGK